MEFSAKKLVFEIGSNYSGNMFRKNRLIIGHLEGVSRKFDLSASHAREV